MLIVELYKIFFSPFTFSIIDYIYVVDFFFHFTIILKIEHKILEVIMDLMFHNIYSITIYVFLFVFFICSHYRKLDLSIMKEILNHETQ